MARIFSLLLCLVVTTWLIPKSFAQSDGAEITLIIGAEGRSADVRLRFVLKKATHDRFVMTSIKIWTDAIEQDILKARINSPQKEVFVHGWIASPTPAEDVWIGTIVEAGTTGLAISVGSLRLGASTNSFAEVFRPSVGRRIYFSIGKYEHSEILSNQSKIISVPTTKVEIIGNTNVRIRPVGRAKLFQPVINRIIWSESDDPTPISFEISVEIEDKFLKGWEIFIFFFGGLPFGLLSGKASSLIPLKVFGTGLWNLTQLLLGGIFLILSFVLAWLQIFTFEAFLVACGLAVATLFPQKWGKMLFGDLPPPPDLGRG